MARYYFHLRDGQDVLLDPEGRELPDVAAIAREALLDARSLISDDARNGRIRLDQRIDVEDEHEALIYSLLFEDAVTIIRTAQA